MPIKLQKMWHNSCTTRILKMLNIVNYIERTPRSYWNVHAIHHQSVNEKMCPKKCHLSWMDDKNSEKSCKYFFCHHNWRKREQSGREFWGGRENAHWDIQKKKCLYSTFLKKCITIKFWLTKTKTTWQFFKHEGCGNWIILSLALFRTSPFYKSPI